MVIALSKHQAIGHKNFRKSRKVQIWVKKASEWFMLVLQNRRASEAWLAKILIKFLNLFHSCTKD